MEGTRSQGGMGATHNFESVACPIHALWRPSEMADFLFRKSTAGLHRGASPGSHLWGATGRQLASQPSLPGASRNAAPNRPRARPMQEDGTRQLPGVQSGIPADAFLRLPAVQDAIAKSPSGMLPGDRAEAAGPRPEKECTECRHKFAKKPVTTQEGRVRFVSLTGGQMQDEEAPPADAASIGDEVLKPKRFRMASAPPEGGADGPEGPSGRESMKPTSDHEGVSGDAENACVCPQ